MAKIKLTITDSCCRSGYFKGGETFIVDDLCPPLCHELWNVAYPYIFALKNGATLDKDSGKATVFDCACPDGGRVKLQGEVVEE